MFIFLRIKQFNTHYNMYSYNLNPFLNYLIIQMRSSHIFQFPSNMNFEDTETLTHEPESQSLIVTQYKNTGSREHYNKVNSSILKQIKGYTLVCLIVLYSLYYLYFPKIEVECVMDLSFVVTTKLNQWLNQSKLFYNIWAIAHQEIIEFNFIVVSFLLLFEYKNLKIAFYALVFFSVRGAIFIRISQLPYQKGIISYYPSFPAYTVPYGITRDFYYSGHTGFLLLTMTELYLAGYQRLFRAYFILSSIVIGFLISSRVHYIIDVIGAAIFTCHIYRFVLPNVIILDAFFSYPFKLYKTVVNRSNQMIN